MKTNIISILTISSLICIVTAEIKSDTMEKKMKLAQIAKECSMETQVDDLSARRVILGELSSIDDDDVRAKVSSNNL